MIYNKSNKNLDWDTKKLNELGDFSRGKSKHRPRNDVKLFSKKGYPLIQTGEVKNANLYINENKDYYNDFGLKQSKLWNKGTLAITIAANIADSAVLGYDMCFPDSIVGFEPYKKETSSEYMHYVLSYIQQSIQKSVNGSIQDNINIEYLQALDFKMPKKQIQDEILDIIISLDKKIETNNKINAELEKMAKTLYDYWFVQFDFPNEDGKPYRTIGGAMTYNPTLKREIPKNWEVKKLGDLISEKRNIFSGDKDNVYGIDLSVMHSKTLCLTERSRADSFDTNQFEMEKFDILFGSIRPYLLKAGFAPFNGVVNGTVHCFRVKEKINYSFALITTVSDSMFSYAVTRSGGTKMPIIKSEEILDFNISYNKEVVKEYEKKVCNYWRLIAKNIQENFELAELRDFLLPLLMTGQVQVVERQEQPFSIENGQEQIKKDKKYFDQRFDMWLENQGLAARGAVDKTTLRAIFDAMDDEDK